MVLDDVKNMAQKHYIKKVFIPCEIYSEEADLTKQKKKKKIPCFEINPNVI